MSFPVSGNYETRVAGTTTVKKAWADAVDSAFNGLYGASKSALGLALDATGYVSRVVATRTIKAFGGSLNLDCDTGAVQVLGAGLTNTGGFLTQLTGSAGSASILFNDTSVSPGSGAQTEWLQAQGNGVDMAFTMLGTAQTTDGTTQKQLMLIPMPQGALQLVTTILASDSTHTVNYRWAFSDGFRRSGGGIVEDGGGVKPFFTAVDEFATVAAAPAWAISGSNLILGIKGKAANTINWLVRVDVMRTS